MVDSEAEVSKIAEERGWKVLGGVFQFKVRAMGAGAPSVQTSLLSVAFLRWQREADGPWPQEATEKSHEAIPTLQLITNSLMYARELERIV